MEQIKSKEAKYKNKRIDFMQTLFLEKGELFKLNLVFVLCCLLVITIPASISALSRVTLDMFLDEHGNLIKDFLKTFKSNFKKSTICGLAMFAMIFFVAFAAYYYWIAAISSSNMFYIPFITMLIALITLVFSSFYMFTLIALVDLPLKNIVKNSIALSLKQFKNNVLSLIIAAILILFLFSFIPFSFVLVLLGWPVIICCVIVYLSYPGIEKCITIE